MELTIGVGEGDQLKFRGLKSGAQGSAVAAIRFVAQQAYMGSLGGKFFDDRGSAVTAAIVHDKDFVIGGESGQGKVAGAK